MSTTVPITNGRKLETPFTFTTAALGSDVAFWRSYIAARPSPSDDFFTLINEYHARYGDYNLAVAHDIGTGPGNIAQRLAKYYDHVVGSDINEQALAAALSLISSEILQRMTFVHAPAEDVANKSVVPAVIGNGKTDLVVVSECMPLLDPVKSLDTFNTLLRPNGTLAIYFYGRPLFTHGDNKEACDELYDRIATRICTFLLPFRGTPAFPFQQRSTEALVSWMDNIAFPATSWHHVHRYKWNNDFPLLFNSKDGYDFEFEPVDRRGEGEVTTETVDRGFWQDDWDVERVSGYLASVFPNYHINAGERIKEVEDMLEELKTAMGGSRRVSFPVSLILAKKK
ncbi:hypothetical protein LTR08_008385 [Meristemomyces frigidus]|nr:hypothetical protein LTR08_008385 [Meristemomyces frigidus]